jgi:hypothetical protein
MPLTLFSFLRLFDHKTPPFQEWLQQAQVHSGNKLTPLKNYQEVRKIPLEALKRLYDHILRRDEYLQRFYQTSLHYDRLQITDEPMPKTHLDNNTKVNYKNAIRHLHFRNILQKTKSGLQGLPSFLDVLFDLYTRNIIDYKILTPSALHYLEAGRIGSVFSSFYFRASIMNPYLVFSLNHRVLKGTRIFTPTLGWSSYAYGFAECPQVQEYVGVDVIPDVCQKTTAFLTNQYPRIKQQIYCQPSESLLNNKPFMTQYRNHFDVVFFSPPYYELELYPGKNQSTSTYKTYEEWLEGYWRKTIELCSHVLQPKGKLCYILSSGGGNQSADILKDMNTITATLFRKQDTLPMYNKNVHVTAHRETAEKIMLYVKK